jgi:hypothetical protein
LATAEHLQQFFAVSFSHRLNFFTMTPSLLLCGSQAIQWSDDYLASLREVLLADPILQPFADAIRELPRLWGTLLEADSALKNISGKHILERFSKWLDGETLLDTGSIANPNLLLSPLTVISQVVEYLNYLDTEIPTQSHLHILNGVKDGGIQGFCTGFLTAVALSSSRDNRDIVELGAVALRLAACIGAYVDLDQHNTSEFVCLAGRWAAAADEQKVNAILAKYDKVSGTSFVLDSC